MKLDQFCDRRVQLLLRSGNMLFGLFQADEDHKGWYVLVMDAKKADGTSVMTDLHVHESNIEAIVTEREELGFTLNHPILRVP
jgi:hypothetical protein